MNMSRSINYLRSVKYETLEREVLDAENTLMTLKSGDDISLMLAVKEGNHTIDVVMPWNNIFQIGNYTSEQEARKEYSNYLNQLRNGYRIHITDNKTAEIIEPESL